MKVVDVTLDDVVHKFYKEVLFICRDRTGKERYDYCDFASVLYYIVSFSFDNKNKKIKKNQNNNEEYIIYKNLMVRKKSNSISIEIVSLWRRKTFTVFYFNEVFVEPEFGEISRICIKLINEILDLCIIQKEYELQRFEKRQQELKEEKKSAIEEFVSDFKKHERN